MRIAMTMMALVTVLFTLGSTGCEYSDEPETINGQTEEQIKEHAEQNAKESLQDEAEQDQQLRDDGVLDY